MPECPPSRPPVRLYVACAPPKQLLRHTDLSTAQPPVSPPQHYYSLPEPLKYPPRSLGAALPPGAERFDRIPIEVAIEMAPVILHVYDLGTSPNVLTINRVSYALGGGLYHTAIEVYGQEYSFG
jgi:hypothetical protein